MTFQDLDVEITVAGKIKASITLDIEQVAAFVAQGATAVFSMTEDQQWDLWLAWVQGNEELEGDELLLSFTFYDHGRHFAQAVAATLRERFPGIDVRVLIEPREDEWTWDLVGQQATWPEPKGASDATVEHRGLSAGD